MPGITAWEAETAEVLLVAIQAGAVAGAAATASPTTGAAAEVAIAGPVIAAGVLPAPKDTGSATRQDQPRSSRSARLWWETRRRRGRGRRPAWKKVWLGLNACGVALQQLSHATDSQSTHIALGKVADRSMQFLHGHDGRFERMLDTLQTLPIRRVDAERVRRGFGEVKEFPNIDLLVQIISEGAPVALTEKGVQEPRQIMGITT